MSESLLVTPWLSNIAFHLLPIWLQSLVAIDPEFRLTSFPSFCAPPSEVAALFAVQFKSEQTPLPRAGSQNKPAALHRIRFGTCDFVPMSYFCSETNKIQQMIEKFSEAMGTALVDINFLPILWKFHVTWKKK